MTTATTNKLNLIPNEIVGYRIHPDQWNWKVVVVKKHGAESKNAGKEYETNLAYCKNLTFAIKYIVNYVSAIEGDKEQKLTFEKEGVLSDLESLKVAINKAEEAALGAVKDLEERLVAAGYNLSDIPASFKRGEVEEVKEKEIEE